MSEAQRAHGPIAALTREHQVVLVVVHAMEREATHIRNGGAVHGEAIDKMLTFNREFTDRWHHAKEEKVLFPKLGELSPAARSPLRSILTDHDEGRRYTSAIVEALPAARAGDPYAAMHVADCLYCHATLLRKHIRQEDLALFALAEKVLTPDGLESLAKEFERVEREESDSGTLTRYEALARELEQPAA